MSRYVPPTRRSTGILVALTVAGVLLRALLLWAAGSPELFSDEANYVFLGLSWNYFGFYEDLYRFLWPPGYPFLIALALEAFEVGGLLAVKLAQILASGSIGLFTMLLARSLFGQRAAVIAGVGWCLYLPLAAFTHLLWSETFFAAAFVPALYLIFGAIQEEDDSTGLDLRLLSAGLLLGLAVYFKEVIFYLIPVMALLVVAAPRPGLASLRRALLVVLPIVIVILPWTLRNFEVYGRFAPMGVTLGENVFRGLNEEYNNFDWKSFDRSERAHVRPSDEVRSWFVEVEPSSGWERAHGVPNTVDRLAIQTSAGLRYASEHPEWLVRSRIKKLADLVSPLSFFLRHQGLARYESPLADPWLRRPLVVWALICPIAALVLGVAGFFWAPLEPRARMMILLVVGYFAATSLLVSMSRFRVPFVPLLIVVAAGFLASPLRDRRGGRAADLAVAVGVALLGVAWWIDLPEVATVVELAWR